jgi:hypothetical protein
VFLLLIFFICAGTCLVAGYSPRLSLNVAGLAHAGRGFSLSQRHGPVLLAGDPCCPRFSFTLGKKHDRRRVSIICIARVDARVEIWESLGGGGASDYTDCGEISRVVYMFGVVKGSVVSSGSKKHATNVIATATSIHQILALSSSEGQSVYTPRRRETAVLRY